MKRKTMIRDATSEDTKLLADIIKKSFQDVALRFGLTPANCPKHPSNCTVQWIESDRNRGVLYSILSNGSEPLGCVGLEKANATHCYLERLAVLPEMRRNGYGRALVLHALERAKAVGALTVGIGIIADQNELNAWYANLGFLQTGTKKFAYLPFEVAFMEFDIQK